MPADCVLLASESSRHMGTDEAQMANDSGLCFIDTKNLDGETNLKIFQGFPDLQHYRDVSNLIRCLPKARFGG